MKFLKNKKGFTLIELLVVVSIIGVLASIVLTSLNETRQKTLDKKFVSEINSIRTAMELYYLDNDEYPQTNSIPNQRYIVYEGSPYFSGFESSMSPYIDLPIFNRIGNNKYVYWYSTLPTHIAGNTHICGSPEGLNDNYIIFYYESDSDYGCFRSR